MYLGCLGALALALYSTFSIAVPTRARSPHAGHKFELSPFERSLADPMPHHLATILFSSPHRTTRSLQRRTWRIDYLDEGFALYFNTYQQYLNIQNSAAALDVFYSSIRDSAAGQWLQQSPMKDFSIELGDLILEFHSNAAAVPWSFIEAFAERMVNSVRSGFTGAFEAYLEHMVSGGVIYVKLRTTLNKVRAG